VTLNVLATGTQPRQYLWYQNATNLIQNSASPSLVLSQLGPTNEGSYFVVITNAYGTVTSQVAILAFSASDHRRIGRPNALCRLELNQHSGRFRVGPLVYQWQLNGNETSQQYNSRLLQAGD